jgi:hypothetical protein
LMEIGGYTDSFQLTFVPNAVMGNSLRFRQYTHIERR